MKKSHKKILIAILVVIILLCVGYIAYFVIDQYYLPHKSDKEVDSIRDEYEIEPEEEEATLPSVSYEIDDKGNFVKVPLKENTSTGDTTPETDNSNTVEDNVSEQSPGDEPTSQIDKVRELNGNIKAWIYVNDTTIDYPVVQGSNNNYYLRHDHNGRYTQNGAIFLDHRCSLDSQNIVIYGHNMRANVMFTSLVKYKTKSFAEDHSSIYLDIGDGGNKYWDVIAAFACKSRDIEKFQKFSFSQETMSEFLADIDKYKYFDTGIEYGETNQYVTLITCSYEYNNARTVVVARRR